jgi:hypothetical protein
MSDELGVRNDELGVRSDELSVFNFLLPIPSSARLKKSLNSQLRSS